MIALLAAAAISSTDPAKSPVSEAHPPVGWEKMVDDFLGEQLKDPFSAVKKITRGPRFAGINPSIWAEAYGWAVCYSINAKNSYGAYEGAKPYMFLIRDGGVAYSFTQHGRNVDPELERECSKAADAAPSAPPSPNPKLPS